jgi:hypothetical protein
MLFTLFLLVFNLDKSVAVFYFMYCDEVLGLGLTFGKIYWTLELLLAIDGPVGRTTVALLYYCSLL